MNYKEFIQNIIDTRGQWNIPNGDYYEVHHIIPRCIGGGPKHSRKGCKNENLIWLYPEEHYMAHYYLAIENKNIPSLVYSWNMMNNFKKHESDEIDPSEYSKLKKLFIKYVKLKSKENYFLPEIYKKRMSSFYNTINNRSTNRKKEISKNCSRPGKINGRSEKVLCITTGKVYECKKWAARENNIPYKKFINLLKENKPDQNNNYYKILTYKDSNLKMKTVRMGGNNPSAKKIICVETSQVFNTISEAAAEINISRQGLQNKIKNNKPDINGNHWRYL